jgi:hypothetical protein
MDTFEHPWFDTVGGIILPSLSRDNLSPMNISGLKSLDHLTSKRYYTKWITYGLQAAITRDSGEVRGKFLSKKLRAKKVLSIHKGHIQHTCILESR